MLFLWMATPPFVRYVTDILNSMCKSALIFYWWIRDSSSSRSFLASLVDLDSGQMLFWEKWTLFFQQRFGVVTWFWVVSLWLKYHHCFCTGGGSGVSGSKSGSSMTAYLLTGNYGLNESQPVKLASDISGLCSINWCSSGSTCTSTGGGAWESTLVSSRPSKIAKL